MRGTTNPEQALVRVVTILSWTYAEEHRDTSLTGEGSLAWFGRLVTVRHKLLKQFCNYMISPPKSRSAGTIVQFLNNFSLAMNWLLVYYDPGDTSLVISEPDLAKVKIVVKHLLKLYRKKMGSRSKTLEDALDAGQLPPGGLFQLQQPVQQAMASFHLNGDEPCDKLVHARFMEPFVCSFYAYGLQGRIDGLNKLGIKEGKQLEATGTTMSPCFKTDSKFVKQPVTYPISMLPYLTFYIAKVLKYHLYIYYMLLDYIINIISNR